MHRAGLLSALALLSAVSAVPVKRDVEIETVTEVDYVFQMVTATVWVDATDAANPSLAPYSPYSTSVAAATTTAARVQQYKAPPPPPAPTTSSSSSSVAPPPPPPTTTTTPVAAPAPPPPAPTTSTSSYQAPEQPAVYVPPPAPTTTVAPAPAPAPAPTTEAPPPPPPAPTTTAQAPAASPASGSSSPSGNTYTGEITYYAVGLGSCGNTNSDSEFVVAMSAAMMNKATMCGKSITLSYQGVTQTATVVDTCPGCSSGSLDLSPSLFKAIAPNGDGRVHGVQWWFN